MKIFSFLSLLILALPLRAADAPDAIQRRLLQVEMAYAEAIGSGKSEEEPKLRGMKNEITAIGKIPDVRNQHYWDLVKEKKQMLEVDLAKLSADGKGSQHPEMQSVQAQLAVVEAIEKTQGETSAPAPAGTK